MNRHDIEKSLLLVVDVQNGFINQNTQHVIEPINRLIDQWRAAGSVILFSKFVNPEGSQWEKLLQWDKMRSSPEIDFPAELNVGEAEVKTKGTYSMWSDELAEYCGKNNLDTVVICGIDTDQCVLATAIDIFESSLKPVVVKHCCASSAGNQFHTAGLMLLERLIGKDRIISKEEFET